MHKYVKQFGEEWLTLEWSVVPVGGSVRGNGSGAFIERSEGRAREGAPTRRKIGRLLWGAKWRVEIMTLNNVIHRQTKKGAQMIFWIHSRPIFICWTDITWPFVSSACSIFDFTRMKKKACYPYFLGSKACRISRWPWQDLGPSQWLEVTTKWYHRALAKVWTLVPDLSSPWTL